jgi:transcription elongation factor Elf1
MVTFPKSANEVIYFTNRTFPNGWIKGWTHRKDCPKCGKAKMGKPVEKGKVKIRATEYVCPECKYSEEKQTHEESLTLEAQYKCPHCGKEGESSTPYKRKAYMGVPSYVVECQHCGEKIALTKKLKDPKSKKNSLED